MIVRIDPQEVRESADEGLTVIVPTRNRRALLDRLLTSLEGEWQDLEQVVVVVNATSDDTLELLERYSALRPRLHLLELNEGGKSRAINQAIASSDGEYLAFLDDDVAVRPGWAAAYLQAFRISSAAALQGRILLPRKVREDEELMRRVLRLRTHVRVDYGHEPRLRRSLTGANMAVRRSVLEQVGLFDEHLGPGAAGLCEDTDLAWRILDLGGSIEYVPEAAVEHHFHPTRVTEGYFQEYFHKLGCSRWLMKGRPSTLRVLPDYLTAWAREACSVLSGDADRRTLTRARRLHYTAMLECARRSAAVRRTGTNGSPWVPT